MTYGKQFGPGEMISVSGSSKGLAQDTVITVDLDGTQTNTTVKTDGSWEVNIQTPSKVGSYKITVSAGQKTEQVTIRVVDDGGSSGQGSSFPACLGFIVLIFIIVAIVLLVRRSRRRRAMADMPPPAPAQAAPAPAKAKAAPPVAPPPPAKAKPAAPKAAPATAKAKPTAPSAQSKPAKGQPAPPPEPEEMPEMPMAPPEISMDEVFEDGPEVFEPGAPIEEELTKEKVEDVREEDLGGERKPLSPDQQKMYKRAQGLERALNFERAALMYEDLEMWDDARRCRQAKMKEDASKDLDLNVYRGRAPTSKSKSAQGDFDEFGQIKDAKGAMFSCPGCGTMISSQPCRRCGWHGGHEHMEKMMREKKM